MNQQACSYLLCVIGLTVPAYGQGHRLWSVGQNRYGQLGLGVQNWAPSPALIGNVKAAATGWRHNLVLNRSGEVWAFGNNTYGQLGDGTTTNRSVPVQVPCPSGIIAVSGGDYFSLALRSDGTVWGWGSNGYGQLGDNTTTERHSPIQMHGPLNGGMMTNVAAIDAGDGYCLLLRADGTVWSMGNNSKGQLGDGTTSTRWVPGQVHGPGGSGFLTGIIGISAGHTSSAALKNDGTVWTWGYNSSGELGDGTATTRYYPVQVHGSGDVGFLSNISRVSAGQAYMVALAADGTAWAWGSNGFGQLGINSPGTMSSPLPVQVHNANDTGFLTGVTSLVAGPNHCVAMTSDGAIWTWGWNYWGNLGTGAGNGGVSHPTPSPTQITGPVDPIAVDGGYTHTIAVERDGSLWAWGDDSYGQLADATNGGLTVPLPMAGVPDGTAMYAGKTHCLAIRSVAGVSVLCAWGANHFGQLGDGTWESRASPVDVSIRHGIISAAAASGYHSLASDGTASSWGWNNSGQLGWGVTDGFGDNVPADVHAPGGGPGTLTGISSVRGGYTYSAALATDGTVWTWGNNDSGQLGNNTYNNSSVPVHVANPAGTGVLDHVSAIASGYEHCLALRDDGTVWAWGSNFYSQCGSAGGGVKPTQVTGLSSIIGIAAGDYHSMALKSDGSVWTWGKNDHGQIGDGTTANRMNPFQVALLPAGIQEIAAGAAHSLARDSSGNVYAWGQNTFGELGNGTTADAGTPAMVAISGVTRIAAGGEVSLFLSDAAEAQAPAVVATWPVAGSIQPVIRSIVVEFSEPVTGVSADDLVLSTGHVVSVAGRDRGPYLFRVAGTHPGIVSALLDGDIRDAAGNDLPAFPLTVAQSTVPADFDLDGHVSGPDVDHLIACSTGSGVPQNSDLCHDADLDGDHDVDADDFGLLQRCYSGASDAPDPACVD